MITLLLVAQAGEAFAVSSMACFDREHGMMVSEIMAPRLAVDKASENAMSHALVHSTDAAQSMNIGTKQTAESMQMMNHDCCQQDCDCPLGMLSLAVLIDLNIQAATHQSDDQLVDNDSSLVFTFIPSQQRPPKYLSNFAV
jgi:hypothetical protein